MDVVRTVSWSKTGLKQRNKVFEYWDSRNKSVAYSTKLNLEIRERTNLLKINSKLGHETIFPNTRTVTLLNHYSILYKITETVIIITGFWDNRRNPEKLLKFLKKTD